jgi:hypothetical protein
MEIDILKEQNLYAVTVPLTKMYFFFLIKEHYLKIIGHSCTIFLLENSRNNV